MKNVSMSARVMISIMIGFGVVMSQTKPNLTGTWKMNASESKFEGGGPSAITIKIDQKDDLFTETLVITRDDGSERTVNLKYSVDGKETAVEFAGRAGKVAAKWEGESLIVSLKGDEDREIYRKITLSKDGKRMSIAVRDGGPNGGSNDTIVFEKQ